MSDSGPYKLISVLHAHDGPIRSITMGPSGEIVTGCQSDAPNFRRWILSPATGNGVELLEKGTMVVHDHWVVALTSLPPCPGRAYFPEGCIISGCQDAKIRIYSTEGLLLQTLTGHEKGVVSFSWTVPTTPSTVGAIGVDASSSPMLLSGSWDGTARMWNLATGQCVMQLGPHENGVQVLGLSNGQIATTSTGESVNGRPANFKLRIWDSATGKSIGTALDDHSGSIRSIRALPGIGGFATTSNDGSVVLRGIDGAPIEALMHPPNAADGSMVFVFDSCALDTPSGMELVSCGEDGSVMVWSGTELVQALPHPNTVWTVMALPNSGGDFATCGHDGVLRIFSKNATTLSTIPETVVNQLTAEFQMEVEAAQSRHQKGPTSEELAKSPKWEERHLHPGNSDDQVSVFNKDGSMIAAQWISGSWVIIGSVTGSGDGGNINDVWYDHVMPVEIDTPRGVVNLKLGHNNGENPFVAAQRFIDQNELQQSYLSEIADWITARSGQSMPTLGGDVSAGSANGPNINDNNDNNNNYNSAGISNIPPVPPVPPKAFSYQATAFATFDDVPNLSKLLTKLRELNGASSASQQVSEADLISLENLVNVLQDTSHYHSSVITASQLQSLIKPTLAWDKDKLFPLFDLLRVVAIHPSGAEELSRQSALIPVVQRAIEVVQTEPNAGDVPFASVLTALRFLCNLVKHSVLGVKVYAPGAEMVHSAVLVATPQLHKHSNKLVRVVASRLVLNVAAFTCQSSGPCQAYTLSPTITSSLVTAAMTSLTQEKEHPEVVFNAMKTLGTLFINRNSGGGVTAEQQATIRQVLQNVQQQWSQSQLGDVCYACLMEAIPLFA